MWNVGMLRMWDVGCSRCGMFKMWDVRDVRCSGCGMFAGMWDVNLQNVNLFNLSFMTGVFPSVLKTAKVVPVFKKDSKFHYNYYRPISLLSNIEKILKN